MNTAPRTFSAVFSAEPSAAFAARARAAARSYETAYALGMFGSPLSAASIAAKARQYPHWYTPERIAALSAKAEHAARPVFGFDCVCFLKGLLWGWRGDASLPYGGAVYLSNGVEDLNEDGMFSLCTAVSSDFSSLAVGEALWSPGHIGIAIGDGLCAECTPAWEGGVQITSVRRTVPGYHRRDWHRHGKLPYLDYTGASAAEAEQVLIGLPILSRGSVGYPVRTLQRLLNAVQPAVLDVDGSFGPATEAALRIWQASVSLVPDASCGPATWSALLKG